MSDVNACFCVNVLYSETMLTTIYWGLCWSKSNREINTYVCLSHSSCLSFIGVLHFFVCLAYCIVFTFLQCTLYFINIAGYL